MPFRNFLIRIAADSIYFLHRKQLSAHASRIIVFTGTAGKTLARTAVAYALARRGKTFVSPPYGYTNELGIVLAMLGLTSVSLHSFKGLRRILEAEPLRDAYVLVEIGADWRADISWFLKRFTPYGVCLVDIAEDEWTRSKKAIWKDKEALLKRVPKGGFVAWSERNPSAQAIRDIRFKDKNARDLAFTVSPAPDSFLYARAGREYTLSSTLAELLPYREAFGFAVATLEAIDALPVLEATLFRGFGPVEGRLRHARLPAGPLLIEDTYKAIPHCTKYVLEHALALPAEERILVLSAMHPLWQGEAEQYRKLIGLLVAFDTVYFLGTARVGSFLKKQVPNLKIISPGSTYDALAAELRLETSPETIITIKGAGRYHLERLVAMLKGVMR